MRHTTLCVPLEVKPESCSRLTVLIDQLREREDDAGNPVLLNFHRLHEQVPTLHFLSMSVFSAADYDPLFVLEANFDGRPGPFWAQLEAVIGPDLQAMLRCCKRPMDKTGELYDAVTAVDARVTVAPYLEARTQRPSVFHHGNRGLTRNQVLEEQALFLATTAEIDRPGPSLYRGRPAGEVHAQLRQQMLAANPWLGRPAPPRIGFGERIGDALALLAFVAALLLVLAAPGLAVGALGLVRPCWLAVLLSVVALVAILAAWLRWLEIRDSSHDRPRIDERLYRDMVRREDWVTQNHMGSVVLIKPGVLRTVIIKAGHLGLHLLLRASASARQGYLGSMRTVHFAHWAFLNNSSRLLFLSNFDHSWDSYLDDFIEKAHAGLTLAWGCGVGFPPTRWLINDGASRGRQFKAWALASRAVSRFWYSAYPGLTVDQIERNHRIANGLRKVRMNDSEAALWMQDL